MNKPLNYERIDEYKETELGKLPNNWRVESLNEHCKILSGFAFKSKDFEQEGILVIKIGNLQNGTIIIDNRTSYFPPNKLEKNLKEYILKEGDILIALTGATTGKTAIVPRKYKNSLLNQRVGKIKIFSGELDKSYLGFFSKTSLFLNEVLGNILKSAQGNVSPKKIENIKIPLPPLHEQKKIAAVLSAVQEAKEKTEEVIKAAKELKKSLMKHLFTYGPVSIEEAEKVRLKETEIGMIPEDWIPLKLGEVTKKMQYGISMRGQAKGKYPILRMNNLVDGYVDTSDMQFLDIKEDIFNKYQLNIGDILFNRTNSFELVGKSSIFDIQGDFVFASYLIRVIPEKNKLDSYYLNYYLNWEKTQYRLKSIASRGVSQSNISASKLKLLWMALPPLSIQQNISNILSTIDQKIQAEENKKKALEKLFKSLLNNLMTGKIRVNNLDIYYE